jgi:hypothetical protein
MGKIIGAIIFFAALSPAMAQSASKLNPHLEAVISAQLKKPGSLGDALRSFHSCVVKAVLKNGAAFQGVMGVFAHGQPCFDTSHAVMAQCIRTQHDPSACALVVLTTSAHAEEHANDFRKGNKRTR